MPGYLSDSRLSPLSAGYPGPKGTKEKGEKQKGEKGYSAKNEKKPIFSKRPGRKPAKPFAIEIPFFPRMFVRPRVKRHRAPVRDRRRNDRLFPLRYPRQYKGPRHRVKGGNHQRFSRLKDPIILRPHFIREPVGRNE